MKDGFTKLLDSIILPHAFCAPIVLLQTQAVRLKNAKEHEEADNFRDCAEMLAYYVVEQSGRSEEVIKMAELCGHNIDRFRIVAKAGRYARQQQREETRLEAKRILEEKAAEGSR